MTFEPLTAERRRQQTREVLLQAAAQVFAERGFHGASLDEVAAAAGFTKGAVYSNFKSKDDLFLALLEASYARELEEIHRTIEGSEVPPQERLNDFVSLVRNGLDQTAPDSFATLYLEFSLYAMRNPAARERLNQLEAADIRAVAQMIDDGLAGSGAEPSASAVSKARLVTALFRGINLMRVLNPDAVPPELFEEALSFAVRGIGIALPEAEAEAGAGAGAGAGTE